MPSSSLAPFSPPLHVRVGCRSRRRPIVGSVLSLIFRPLNVRMMRVGISEVHQRSLRHHQRQRWPRRVRQSSTCISPTRGHGLRICELNVASRESSVGERWDRKSRPSHLSMSEGVVKPIQPDLWMMCTWHSSAKSIDLDRLLRVCSRQGCHPRKFLLLSGH